VSFSSDLKEELVALPVSSSETAFYEFAGMLKFRGNLLMKREEGIVKKYFTLSTSNPAVARRIHFLLKSLPMQKIETTYSVNHFLEKAKTYQLKIENSKIEFFLKKMGIHPNFEEKIFELLEEDPGFFGDFLRGAFLIAGYALDPKKGYHLEFIEKDSEYVSLNLGKILFRLFDINSGRIKTDKGIKLYLKGVRDIIEVLELMGSSDRAALYETIYDQRKVKSDVNRSINFTLANADKTAASSFKQIEKIKKLKERISLDKIDKELYELAVIRINNEDMTLSEMGQKMKKQLSKSAVYNRLKKLMKMAEDVEEEEYELPIL